MRVEGENDCGRKGIGREGVGTGRRGVREGGGGESVELTQRRSRALRYPSAVTEEEARAGRKRRERE